MPEFHRYWKTVRLMMPQVYSPRTRPLALNTTWVRLLNAVDEAGVAPLMPQGVPCKRLWENLHAASCPTMSQWGSLASDGPLHPPGSHDWPFLFVEGLDSRSFIGCSSFQMETRNKGSARLFLRYATYFIFPEEATQVQESHRRRR